MKWTATMTAAALELIAQGAGPIVLSSAWAGYGTSGESTLANLTSLANPAAPLSIINENSTPASRRFRLQISSQNVPQSFLLTQLGVFARVGAAPEKLVFIAQNAAGESIPSKSDTQNFIAEYSVSLDFDHADVSISSQAAGFVTPDFLDQRLQNFVATPPPQNPADIFLPDGSSLLAAVSNLRNDASDLRAALSELAVRFNLLENSAPSGVIANSFKLSFENLNAISLTQGLWNNKLARLEC